MTKPNKILLSIPSILSLSYMVILWFPQDLFWLIPSMDVYYIQLVTLQFLTVVQLVVLIRKLWTFKKLEKSKKRDWTWILILFSSIASLIFIWKRMEDFNQINDAIEK